MYVVEDLSNSNLLKVMYGLELKCCVIWRQEVGFVVVDLFLMSEVKVEYDSALTNNTNNSRVE